MSSTICEKRKPLQPPPPIPLPQPHTHTFSSLSHTHTHTPSVAQLDAPSDWRPGGRGFNPHRGRQHSFVETDHIFQISNIFLGHSLPSAYSRRAVVSFWQKNVHNTG